jgi:hypothetical protein
VGADERDPECLNLKAFTRSERHGSVPGWRAPVRPGRLEDDAVGVVLDRPDRHHAGDVGALAPESAAGTELTTEPAATAETTKNAE